jgi:hypothetical protein
MSELQSWLKGKSYYDLVRHLAAGGTRNVFHTDQNGREFSEAMNKLRAELTPEKVAEIHEKAVQGIEPWVGVKH